MLSKVESIAAYYSIKLKEPISINKYKQLFYLADWFHALVDKETMTKLKWTYRYYLDTPNLEILLDNSYLFTRTIRRNEFINNQIKEYSYAASIVNINLTEREKQILDCVIEKTKDFYYNDLVSYVTSTYPFKRETMYFELDLYESGIEYRKKYLRKGKIKIYQD